MELIRNRIFFLKKCVLEVSFEAEVKKISTRE